MSLKSRIAIGSQRKDSSFNVWAPLVTVPHSCTILSVLTIAQQAFFHVGRELRSWKQNFYCQPCTYDFLLCLCRSSDQSLLCCSDLGNYPPQSTKHHMSKCHFQSLSSAFTFHVQISTHPGCTNNCTEVQHSPWGVRCVQLIPEYCVLDSATNFLKFITVPNLCKFLWLALQRSLCNFY